jgi:putative ABC transport system permease protein
LGADRTGVLWLVVGQSMRVILAGVALGVAGSLALVHLMQNLIYGIGPFDPVTFSVVVALLSTTALLACWLPARRAAKVDPMVALRSE